MKKLIFLIPLFIFADVNPFNAGLNSPNPYGLTPQEKSILQNKKEIAKLKIKIDNLNNQLGELKLKLSNYDDVINQKLSGFSTMLDELNTAKISIQNLQRNEENQSKQIEEINKKIVSLEENITAIKESIKEITKIQNENFNTLKAVIVSILDRLNKLQQKDISPKKAFYKAKKLFFSNRLNKAKELFLYSLQKNYLPATSSYYLGEIAYRKGNYKEALAFYKKSVNLYPKKASFTSSLLFHTAMSFLKLGEKDKAKLTFKKLISDFPHSKYAKLAKKELEKIK